MKYVIGLIVIVGLTLGTYWFIQPRPMCGAVVVASGECLEPVSLGQSTLEVKPSDHQAPNYNPQQTENGAELW